MELCYEDLDRLRYNSKTGKWYNKYYISYVYMNSCKECNEPFLALTQQIKKRKGEFCSISCSVKGKHNPFYGKHHLEETKQKNRKAHLGQKHTEESNIKRSKALKGANNSNWQGGYRINNIPVYNTYANQIDYIEKVRRNQEDKNILEVKCSKCNNWYIPKMTEVSHRIQSLNGNQLGESRLYCSDECKKECQVFNQKKYPKDNKPYYHREVQSELRQMVLERDNWECQKCGKKEHLICHHIEGIRWEPLESADIDQCITVCKDCDKEVHSIDGCRKIDMRCKNKYETRNYL